MRYFKNTFDSYLKDAINSAVSLSSRAIIKVGEELTLFII